MVDYRTIIDVQPGWDQIVVEALTALLHVDVNYGNVPNLALEIRQKYGSLRIDTTRVTPAVETVITTAEAESLRTCEFCGRPGHLRERDDWFATCCDSCATTRLGGGMLSALRPVSSRGYR